MITYRHFEISLSQVISEVEDHLRMEKIDIELLIISLVDKLKLSLLNI